MAISLIREFSQKQKIALTPQLKKSIDLLQLSRNEIIQKINHEIEANPFLEKSPDNLIETFENSQSSSSDYQKDIVINETLRDNLLNQLYDLNLNDNEGAIARSIIDSLDESGALIDDISDIEVILKYKFSYTEIENVLKTIIQNLEPYGVGFRDIKETILIQLKKREIDPGLFTIAQKIIDGNFVGNIYSIKEKLSESYNKDLIEKSIELIKSCDLAPGLDFGSTIYIEPDLVVENSNQVRKVNFINDKFPVINIDYQLVKSVKQELKNKPNKELSEKIKDAKWFLKAIKKRNETVLRVGEIICNKQFAFFEDELLEIKPLTNKEIAKQLGVHPSTVSRILRSKYIQTPRGIIPLKSLLISSVSKTRNVTPIQLMETIKLAIQNEKSKLSDQDIATLLNKRGYNLARRTISKYRLKMNIPSSRKR